MFIVYWFVYFQKGSTRWYFGSSEINHSDGFRNWKSLRRQQYFGWRFEKLMWVRKIGRLNELSRSSLSKSWLRCSLRDWTYSSSTFLFRKYGIISPWLKLPPEAVLQAPSTEMKPSFHKIWLNTEEMHVQWKKYQDIYIYIEWLASTTENVMEDLQSSCIANLHRLRLTIGVHTSWNFLTISTCSSWRSLISRKQNMKSKAAEKSSPHHLNVPNTLSILHP